MKQKFIMKLSFEDFDTSNLYVEYINWLQRFMQLIF